jgi:hypothetical protein
MHSIAYSVRRIAPSELPTVRDLDGTVRPATAQELLNMDIAHLTGDLYSCADQQRRDPDTLAWSVVGVPSPGTVLSEGSLRERHARLPADVQAQLRGNQGGHGPPLLVHAWHGESPH